MSDETMRQLVIEHVAAVRGQGANVDELRGDEALDLTSLELVRVLVNIEEQLNVELDDAAVVNRRLDTIEDIVALLRQALGAPEGVV